ncbi:MAG: FAD-linked oxidase C-terminal domain-containing protein [Verrucomicrobiota bacterium]
MKQASPTQISSLRRSLGKNKVFTDEDSRNAHGGDAWHAHALPDLVVEPHSTSDVIKLMRWSHRYQIPVTARGAGKGYVGGCVPVQGGVSLSLRKMNRILKISAPDSLAIVQPGVNTGHLQRQVEKRGLYYPPDPASLKESSIGGNIATNAGGPRCLKYGVTRQYVLGLEVVLADGTAVRVGGLTHKNKLGFELTGIFVGSEGMLGVVTEATLRLIPYPPSRAAVVATFDTARQAASAVSKIQAAGFLPSALEVADQLTLEAARNYTSNTPDGNAFLLVEIDGQPGAVKSDLKSLKKILLSCQPVQIIPASTPSAIDKLWGMRRDFSYSLRATGLTKLNEDIVVPRGKLVDLFRFTAKLQKQSGIQVAAFGHAGDGNIHVNLMVPPEKAQSKQAQNALNQLFKQVIDWGGTLTGEHGVGLAKKPWWTLATTPELHQLHRTIKSALDPQDLLNPGKFLD